MLLETIVTCPAEWKTVSMRNIIWLNGQHLIIMDELSDHQLTCGMYQDACQKYRSYKNSFSGAEREFRCARWAGDCLDVRNTKIANTNGCFSWFTNYYCEFKHTLPSASWYPNCLQIPERSSLEQDHWNLPQCSRRIQARKFDRHCVPLRSENFKRATAVPFWNLQQGCLIN